MVFKITFSILYAIIEALLQAKVPLCLGSWKDMTGWIGGLSQKSHNLLVLSQFKNIYAGTILNKSSFINFNPSKDLLDKSFLEVLGISLSNSQLFL